MYLLLDGRVLVLDQATMESIPLFKAVFAFSDPDDGATFPLPDVKEFERNGLELLRTLVIFCRDPSSFAIPSKYQEMFSLVRLADFLLFYIHPTVYIYKSVRTHTRSHMHTLSCIIDTTIDDGHPRRLIIHSKSNANISTKLIEIAGTPHFMFFLDKRNKYPRRTTV